MVFQTGIEQSVHSVMSHFAHRVFPLSSVWMSDEYHTSSSKGLWNAGNSNKHSNNFLCGESKSGKTSLLFQYACTSAASGESVLFVCPQKFSTVPVPVHGMPSPAPELLSCIKIMYLNTIEELISYLSRIHLSSMSSSVLIIDDFDYYCSQFKSDDGNDDDGDNSHSVARLFAVTMDTGTFLAKRSNSPCQVLLSSTLMEESFLNIAKQFCSCVWKTQSCNDYYKLEMISSPAMLLNNFSVFPSLTYCFKDNAMFLNSVMSTAVK